MIYKVNTKGYVLVEADSAKEALDKADREEYIEETWWFTSTKPYEEEEEEEGSI